MPTFNVEIVDDRIMVEATLSVPPDGPKSDPFTALVDTGAQATMISEKVANALGAASVGKRNIVSLGGEALRNLRTGWAQIWHRRPDRRVHRSMAQGRLSPRKLDAECFVFPLLVWPQRRTIPA